MFGIDQPKTCINSKFGLNKKQQIITGLFTMIKFFKQRCKDLSPDSTNFSQAQTRQTPPLVGSQSFKPTIKVSINPISPRIMRVVESLTTDLNHSVIHL